MTVAFATVLTGKLRCLSCILFMGNLNDVISRSEQYIVLFRNALDLLKMKLAVDTNMHNMLPVQSTTKYCPPSMYYCWAHTCTLVRLLDI